MFHTIILISIHYLRLIPGQFAGQPSWIPGNSSQETYSPSVSPSGPLPQRPHCGGAPELPDHSHLIWLLSTRRSSGSAFSASQLLTPSLRGSTPPPTDQSHFGHSHNPQVLPRCSTSSTQKYTSRLHVYSEKNTQTRCSNPAETLLNAKQKIIPAAPPCQLWLFHHHYVLKYT